MDEKERMLLEEIAERLRNKEFFPESNKQAREFLNKAIFMNFEKKYQMAIINELIKKTDDKKLKWQQKENGKSFIAVIASRSHEGCYYHQYFLIDDYRVEYDNQNVYALNFSYFEWDELKFSYLFNKKDKLNKDIFDLLNQLYMRVREIVENIEMEKQIKTLDHILLKIRAL